MTNKNKKEVIKDNLSLIVTYLLTIAISFYLTISYAPIEELFPKKLFNTNKVVLIEKQQKVKIVYFDKNKDRIELEFETISPNKKDGEVKILDNNINFFDFLQYNGELYNIELVKANSKNLEKEFWESLDGSFYTAYFDKKRNNLYVFGHNWTMEINGGRLFYDMEQGDKITFTNSLIGKSKELEIDDKTILRKQDFINNFVDNKWFFEKRNSVYLITCYPNYKSYKRLILRLENKNED